MELIWLVVGLLILDLAALLFATDTRPGLERSARLLQPRTPGPRPIRSGAVRHGVVPARTRRVAGG